MFIVLFRFVTEISSQCKELAARKIFRACLMLDDCGGGSSSQPPKKLPLPMSKKWLIFTIDIDHRVDGKQLNLFAVAGFHRFNSHEYKIYFIYTRVCLFSRPHIVIEYIIRILYYSNVIILIQSFIS